MYSYFAWGLCISKISFHLQAAKGLNWPTFSQTHFCRVFRSNILRLLKQSLSRQIIFSWIEGIEVQISRSIWFSGQLALLYSNTNNVFLYNRVVNWNKMNRSFKTQQILLFRGLMFPLLMNGSFFLPLFDTRIINHHPWILPILRQQRLKLSTRTTWGQ